RFELLAPVMLVFLFSSRRRHTRFSRDWSSDVCSSDLELAGGEGVGDTVTETFPTCGVGLGDEPARAASDDGHTLSAPRQWGRGGQRGGLSPGVGLGGDLGGDEGSGQLLSLLVERAFDRTW